MARIRVPSFTPGMNYEDRRKAIWAQPDPSVDLWVALPCQRCEITHDRRSLSFGQLLIAHGPLDEVL